MKQIIFKNAKKAKKYKIISTEDQGCYKKGEVIRSVETDDINQILSDVQYRISAEEIK